MTLYERYSGRLGHLTAAPDPLPDLIAQIGERRGWWTGATAWKRRFARFDPGEPVYASFVYETVEGPQHLAVLRLAEPADTLVDGSANDPILGAVTVAPFTQDAALRGLPALLDNHRDTIRVMRYRPGKRCTLRVDGPWPQARYVKVFGDDQGADVHDNGRRLWQAAQAGDLAFSVAQPVGWDPLTRALWQGSVTGDPVAPVLLGPAGKELARRMGCALASITRSALAPTGTFDFGKQMARTRRYAVELCRRLPDLEGAIHAIVNRLADLGSSALAAALLPIHGSPHMHQWLMDGGQLGLVDFDRMSLGDPELDAATFVAEMDYEDPDCVPVKAINECFLDGYQSIAGPLDARRLLSYRLQKHVAKALKAARAVRRDAPQRAQRNLGRIQRHLQQAGCS